MDLRTKRVLIIGERDGVSGAAIEACLRLTGTKILYVETQCFVWTAAGAMDLESQGRIRQVVDEAGTDEVIAVLGANSSASIEMVATTLASGDPSYAGPLAGVALGIPSFHVLEPEIARQIDPALYERELALVAMVADVEALTAPLRALRESNGGTR